MPDNHRRSARSSRTRSTPRAGAARRRRTASAASCSGTLPHRPPHGPVHDHGLRRVGARGRGDAPRIARRRRRHVHVRRRLGRLRLHPARCGHVRDSGGRPIGHSTSSRRAGSARWATNGRTFLLAIAASPSSLPDRVHDVGLENDVRVLARSRSPGPPAVAPGLERPGPELCGRAIALALALPRCRRSTRVSSATPRRRHRGDRPLHRVHSSGDPALQDGGRVSSAAPGTSAGTTSGSTRSRSSGSSSSAWSS